MKSGVSRKRRILAKIFKALPVVLVIFIFATIIYAASQGLGEGSVRYSHSYPLAVIILLYFLGIYLEKSNR